MEQLTLKIKELERGAILLHQDHDLKLAAKDGEIHKLEKSISEMKASLQDRSFNHQKLQSNLTSEVQALNNKISALEEERTYMIEKHQ